ncbi:ROK family transcriptional regulator [uncultured Sphaerochaeta sp.]|uniref:ROK family transcriptional regulator n=1 Tax=uncultured Sphaerochaeta sp. TaxID=886478 RepID=UPI002A0A73A9|nr:ROK family transcriptional regulator [uncultured Sphaerochaeta sp.]
MSFGKPNHGSNENDLLKHNRSILVKQLMKLGTCSRAELARNMNLTQASISKTVNSLIELGIVEEIAPGKGAKGRRIIPVQLKSDAIQFIGIRLCWNSYFTGVFNLSGDCCEYESSPIDPDDTLEKVLDTIIKIINRYCAHHPKIISAGVSVPSPYIGSEGRILQIGKTTKWEDINVAKKLRGNVGIPVYFKNDAKAGALSEWWFGNHDCHVLVHLLAGECLNASVVVDGEPLAGAYGIAGEIGHMSIDYNGRPCYCSPNSRGCLEQYCSESAFLNDVRQYKGKGEITILDEKADFSVFDIFEAAKAGDGFCIARVRELGFYLGIGLINIINLYNPDVVVISDMMANGGNILLEAIQTTVRDRIQPYVYDRVKIKLSTINREWPTESHRKKPAISSDDANPVIDTSVLGAVAVAIDMFLEDSAQYMGKPGTIGTKES